MTSGTRCIPNNNHHRSKYFLWNSLCWRIYYKNHLDIWSLKLSPLVPPVQKILNQKKFSPIDWTCSLPFFKIVAYLWGRGWGSGTWMFDVLVNPIHPFIIIASQNIFYKNSCLEEIFQGYVTRPTQLLETLKLCYLVIPLAPPIQKNF